MFHHTIFNHLYSRKITLRFLCSWYCLSRAYPNILPCPGRKFLCGKVFCLAHNWISSTWIIVRCMVSITQLFDVLFGTESKKEISKFIGDIFQKCGAKEAKVGGGVTIITILKIILMCLEVYTMRSNTLSTGNTGRIMVWGFERLVFDFSFFP